MGSFLFMLLFSPLLVLTEAAAFYVTGGHKVLLASLVIRPFFTSGFREGEALIVTPLAYGDGLIVSEDSPHDHGQSLQRMLTYLLPDIPQVCGKRYLLTESEFRTLDRMLIPVNEILELGHPKLHGLAVSAAIPVAEFLLRVDSRRVIDL